MQVDVIELYRAGTRLARDEARRAVPVRGELLILKYLAWQSKEVAPVFAEIRPLQLPALDRARILYSRGRNIVLHGFQTMPGGRTHEQIWWCRLVQTAPPPDYSPGVTSESASRSQTRPAA